MAAALLTGCAAQKRAGQTEAGRALFAQAEQALAQQRFVIVLNEIYAPDGTRMEIQHSSLTMQDSRVEIELSPELFQNSPFRQMSDLHFVDQAATLKLKARKKNGDRVYELSVSDLQATWNRAYRFTITLYAGTNDCFIRVDNQITHSRTEVCKFRGAVLPLPPGGE